MKKLTSMLLPAIFAVSAMASGSYEISGYADGSAGIYGTTTDFVGGGSSANYASVVAGDYVDFAVSDTNGMAAAVLRVTIDSFTGDSDSMMLAQTTSSQGLTDTGTFSFSALDAEVTLSFDWYDATGTEALTDQFTITSYDLDWNQYVGMPSSQVDSYLLSGDTQLSYTSSGGVDTFSAGSSDATVDDPDAAFSILTTEGSHQEFTLGKVGSGQTLFMFEFRNPSVLAIPEPATIGMMLTVIGGAVVIRRRVY